MLSSPCWRASLLLSSGRTFYQAEGPTRLERLQISAAPIDAQITQMGMKTYGWINSNRNLIRP
jgi:hypothetical protein